jgi:DNA-binding CsgD family transcriptional regulator
MTSGRHKAPRTTPSPRERECLRLAADGCTYAEVAERLCLSPLTVRNHFDNIRVLTGTRTTTHAVADAIRRGIIE